MTIEQVEVAIMGDGPGGLTVQRVLAGPSLLRQAAE